MRILIIVGAGASYDCWLPDRELGITRLPMSKSLFAESDPQNKYLNQYRLTGLADKLRRTELQRQKQNAQFGGVEFNIEVELQNINDNAVKITDRNTLLALFKARFYIQNLITDLSNKTFNETHGLTMYVTMLNKLKDWIDEKPDERFVDMVVFNYDDLIDRAMTHVYDSDWSEKSNSRSPLAAYYSGKNINIYKPHGSINWGRKILLNGANRYYSSPDDIYREFDTLNITNEFIYTNSSMYNDHVVKDSIPAIAIPFKTKNSFDECPPEMLTAMKEAISKAESILTLGWRGGDNHVVELIKKNGKIRNAYIVSPTGETELKGMLIHPYTIGFGKFIYSEDRNKSIEHYLKIVENEQFS